MVEHKWVTLSNTTLGKLMTSLDSNVVLIALSTIVGKLSHMSPWASSGCS